MAEFEFFCPRCYQSLIVDEQLNGTLTECPSCGETIEIIKPRPRPKQFAFKSLSSPLPKPLPPSFGGQMTMQGVSGKLIVYRDKLEIIPEGVIGFMTKGLKGTKTIPFRSISAIQFKEAGAFFSGYLQFTILGGNESRGGIFDAATDENTFMFTSSDPNANETARKIKAYIERQINALHAPPPATISTPPPATGGLVEELKKLATLRDQGILTDEEFQQAKQRLLK